MKTHLSYLIITFGLSTLLFSCKKDNNTSLIKSHNHIVTKTLILNEGGFNLNNGSLDIYDWKTNQYLSNVTAETKLGDVLNDIKVYGNKIYIVANNSNKVLILNKISLKILATINITQPRFLETVHGKVYCTAYNHSYGETPSNLNGIVAVIDTNTMSVSNQIEVGRQPEGLTVLGSKLYVANSGGYKEVNSEYENSISVIDLNSLTKTSEIKVADNLFQIKAAKNGFLYVSSMGDYASVKPNLFKININTEKVINTYDVPVSKFDINDISNDLYYFTNDKEYKRMNLYSDNITSLSFITHVSNNPYSIRIQPDNGNIYITDTDYTINNHVICYSQGGELLWQHESGSFPNPIAFIE